MAIDLTPNNQQIKRADMAKYPDHKDWPYESLRTISEKEDSEQSVKSPVEQNTALYDNDISTGLAIEIADDEWEIYIPKMFLRKDSSSLPTILFFPVRHSAKSYELVKYLIENETISARPQYQWYHSENGNMRKCHLRLKFESKADADAWIEAKT
jgi:hypothetical protein